MDDALPDLSHHLNLKSEYEHNYYRHGKHQTARNDNSLCSHCFAHRAMNRTLLNCVHYIL